MPYMNFKDLNMYYEDMGCGEPILFLHSHFSRSLLAFGAQIQPFQGEYRCLFPDFRGHGRTKCESLEWDSECPSVCLQLWNHRGHVYGIQIS